MGETRSTTFSAFSEKPNAVPILVSDAFHNFTSFSKKACDFVKFHLKPLKNADRGTTSQFPNQSYKGSSNLELSLERQMYAWTDNPKWVDHPPDIKVTVPKGSLCNLSVRVNVGLPPDAVYNIVTDPDNKRVFKNIKEVISRKVLVDEGLRQVVELEQAAIWRFLWWTGTIAVHVVVDQNRKNHTMKFKQIKSGFMEKFEGAWRVEPIFVDEELCQPLKPKAVNDYLSCTNGKGRIASMVSLEQLIQPAIVPPPPISWYVRGITAKTTEMLINDLLAEAARVRATFGNGDSDQTAENFDERQLSNVCNVKERWTMRRKNSRRPQRRRQKITTTWLKACDVLAAAIWGHEHLVLRAYEGDYGTRKLLGDPPWMSTWLGKRRRVAMLE